MKEIICDRSGEADTSADECCRIAESMIEEIQQIALPKSAVLSSGRGPGRSRDRLSLRKRLLRQIQEARKLAMI